MGNDVWKTPPRDAESPNNVPLLYHTTFLTRGKINRFTRSQGLVDVWLRNALHDFLKPDSFTLHTGRADPSPGVVRSFSNKHPKPFITVHSTIQNPSPTRLQIKNKMRAAQYLVPESD